MLLREAVTPIVSVSSALMFGVFLLFQRSPAPRAQGVPTITIENVVAMPPPSEATPEQLGLARYELFAYAEIAYAKWKEATNRTCPDRLLQLNAWLPSLHAVDPWGRPYQFLCGAQHGVTGIRLRSAGPDHLFDTDDDLSRHR
jgi:hypothetical protein